MYKLKKVIPFIMLLYFIIKANECYGMKISENNVKKTGMEKIKALPHSTKIFIYGNKFFFSLAHSIINNFYELETLEMNKLYSLKKYLCWGYRLQPSFMTPYSFIDFNVNILGGIIDSVMFLILSHSKEYINTMTKGFYIFTSPFNINLNLKITKNFYIAINLTGILRTVALLFLIRNKNINEGKEEKKIFIENNNINNNPKDNLNNANFVNINNNPKDNLNNIIEIKNNENNNIEMSKENEEKIKEITDSLEYDFSILNFITNDNLRNMIIKNNYDENKVREKIDKLM